MRKQVSETQQRSNEMGLTKTWYWTYAEDWSAA